jgi:hypothetical protein
VESKPFALSPSIEQTGTYFNELSILNLFPDLNVLYNVPLGQHCPVNVLKKCELSFCSNRANMIVNFFDCGKSRIGTPIKINRYFMESELKLAVSCIEAHEWAGFGGKAKNILPGVSGIETLEANHGMMAGKYQEMKIVFGGNKSLL